MTQYQVHARKETKPDAMAIDWDGTPKDLAEVFDEIAAWVSRGFDGGKEIVTIELDCTE